VQVRRELLANTVKGLRRQPARVPMRVRACLRYELSAAARCTPDLLQLQADSASRERAQPSFRTFNPKVTGSIPVRPTPRGSPPRFAGHDDFRAFDVLIWSAAADAGGADIGGNVWHSVTAYAAS
jgi:hypothetical protein